MNDPVTELIRASNPQPTNRPFTTEDQLRLEQIMRSPQQEAHRRRVLTLPRMAVAAAIVAVLGLVLGTQFISPFGAPMATASMPAPLTYQPLGKEGGQQALTRLADTVASATPEAAPEEMKKTAWYVHLIEGANGKVEPQSPPADTITHPLGLGRHPMIYDQELAEDQDELLSQLKEAHPIDEQGNKELLVAINDLYLEHAPSPQVRASLLRILADEASGLKVSRTEDRLGRPGLVVLANSANRTTSEALIFDPQNGYLIASEEILLRTNPELDLPVGTVMGYELYEWPGVEFE